MPEKRNESKILAMLERTGVIRKVGIEDGSLDTDSSRSEPDIKPLFNTPDNGIKVTPAARQPIPGMPSPVFPSEKPVDTIEQTRYEKIEKTEVMIAEEIPEYVAEPYTEVAEPLPPPPPPPPPPTPAPAPQVAAPVAPPKPTPVLSGLNPFRSNTVQEETPPPPPPQVVAERSPQPENYTDRFLNTEELYDALALRSKKTDSIYLIEEYLLTLPGSLPDISRREIVGKLIAASGFDYDLLMGDGVLRVKMLKEYAERFARHTDDYIAARQAELDELDQQILRTRRLIENRKDLHKKQFFSIEAEAQRLKDILTFISG